MIIYVTNTFKQQPGDTVLFSTPFGVEIEVQDAALYSNYKLNRSDDELAELFYNAKLEKCLNDRKRAYDKLNQFEMQFDDAINGTTTWKDAIVAIKEEFPKPTPIVKELV